MKWHPPTDEDVRRTTRVPVGEAEGVADRRDKRIVVLATIDDKCVLVVTTYGKEIEDKHQAARMGEVVAAAVGYPSRGEWHEDFRAADLAEAERRGEQRVLDRLEERRELFHDAVDGLIEDVRGWVATQWHKGGAVHMTAKPTAPTTIRWACPRCGAKPNKHGSGECMERGSRCGGFICECWEDAAEGPERERALQDDHGESFANVCSNAVCYHCGWTGVFPERPKGLAPWEKKALDAGWTMPAKRAKELGL